MVRRAFPLPYGPIPTEGEFLGRDETQKRRQALLDLHLAAGDEIEIRGVKFLVVANGMGISSRGEIQITLELQSERI